MQFECAQNVSTRKVLPPDRGWPNNIPTDVFKYLSCNCFRPGLTMAITIRRAKVIIIENVPAIRNDEDAMAMVRDAVLVASASCGG